MLLTLRADEMHRRDDRDEDREGAPIPVLDLRRKGHEREAGQRQPDDGELEGRRSRTEPGNDRIVTSGPHDATWIVRDGSWPRIPRTGDATAELDPSNE